MICGTLGSLSLQLRWPSSDSLARFPVTKDFSLHSDGEGASFRFPRDVVGTEIMLAFAPLFEWPHMAITDNEHWGLALRKRAR